MKYRYRAVQPVWKHFFRLSVTVDIGTHDIYRG